MYHEDMCHASALCYDESTKGKGTEIARWAGNAVHGAKGQGETMSVPNHVALNVLRAHGRVVHDRVVRVPWRIMWPGRGVPELSKADA